MANGLRLVHHEDRNTRMVAVNVAYDVGARDEHPDHTGFAHLLEHMMFEGSLHIADYDVVMQQAGGENNAWTNNDLTNYYLTLPSPNVEVAFWLESDRMLGLDLTERKLDVQRQVVIEEFKQRNLNQPYGDAPHLIREMAYKVHPYRWPTIGRCVEHIATATLPDVEAFYHRHYAPNNAVLAVTGNIGMDDAVKLAEKWFGPIPSREVAPRRLPVEPRQTEERRQAVWRPVPVGAVYMAFPMCGRLDADYHAFDMLSDLLGNGRSSRLMQRLVVDQGVCVSVDSHITGSMDAGLLQIVAKPSAHVGLDEVEAALWRELERLAVEPVGEQELEKVKNRYESEQIFGNINYLNVATNLAYYELLGGAEMLNDEVRKYRQVTAQQLQRVAQEAFCRTKGSILYYHTKD